MKCLDEKFFEKVERVFSVEPNTFDPIEHTAFNALEQNVKKSGEQLAHFQMIFEQKCKQIVIGKMHDLAILNEEDIYINVRYPHGWFALFRVQDVSYFFTFNNRSGVWSVKRLEKSPDNNLEDANTWNK